MERSCATCIHSRKDSTFGRICTNPKSDPADYAANGKVDRLANYARQFGPCGLEGKLWDDGTIHPVPITLKGRYTRWQRFKLWLWEKLA